MSTVDDLIQNATTLARVGKNAEAKQILAQVVKQEPGNARVWLLLGQVADNQEQSIYCFKKVLEIEPFNKPARMWLKSVEEEKAKNPSAEPAKQQKATDTTKPLAVVLLVVVVIVVVVVWVVLNSLGFI